MNHDMVLVEIYQTGAEKWDCRECGRQLVLQWEPSRQIILKEGNNNISHIATKGMKIGEIDITTNDEAWEELLENVNL